MSDAFNNWHVWSRVTNSGNPFLDVGVTIPPWARSWDDPRTVPPAGFDYQLRQTTANGVVIPYNAVSFRTSGNGAVAWVVEVVGTSTVAEVLSTRIAADGSVLFCGDFQGSITVLGTTLTSSGGYDGFVGKLTSGGTLAWLKQYASDGDNSARSVTTDSSGNVYVCGSFMHVVTFGPGVTLTSRNDPFDRVWSDIFVAKYNSSGTLQWAKRFGGTAPDTGDGVRVDSSGNVYFISRLDSSDADYGNITLGTVGNVDIAICKLDSSGTVQWAVRYGGPDINWAHGMALDSSGNVYVAGETWSTSDLGAGPGSHSGTANAFVAKYRVSSGEHLWSKIFDNGSSNRGYGVAVSPTTGNVIFVGGMGGTLDFSSGVAPGQAIASGMFIAAYKADGTYLWQRGYGTSSLVDSLLSVDIDSSDNLSVAGIAYAGAVDFGGGWLIGNGNGNFLVGSFSLSGNSPPVYKWGWRSGAGTNSVSQSNSASLGSGVAIVGGTFQNTTSFSPNGPTLTTPGNALRGFIVKYLN